MPVRLIQVTGYPESDSIELRVEMAAPMEFAIYVRIPGWLQAPPQLSLNGKDPSVAVAPKAFAAIRRRWQPNDTVKVRLPFSWHAEAIDQQHPDTVALMWGPLLMVALDAPLTIPKLVAGMKASASLTFEAYARPTEIRFVPFYQVRDEVYTTYVRQA
jgi:hypothetical protein